MGVYRGIPAGAGRRTRCRVCGLGDYTGECDYDAFDEAYCGEAESEADFAYGFVEDHGLLNEVPESLRVYFDYEAYARDLFSSGYVFHEGYVFSN